MAEQLDQTILDNAGGPNFAANGSIQVSQHPLHEVIDADRYLKGLKLTGSAWGAALRPARCILPGSIGPRST
jgi:hypothetical protein